MKKETEDMSDVLNQLYKVRDKLQDTFNLNMQEAELNSDGEMDDDDAQDWTDDGRSLDAGIMLVPDDGDSDNEDYFEQSGGRKDTTLVESVDSFATL